MPRYRKPKWTKFVKLLGAGTFMWDSAHGKVFRGVNSRIHVVDWNQDGIPDLLVGDSAIERRRKADVTPEEYEEAMAELKKLPDSKRDEARAIRDRAEKRVHSGSVWLFLSNLRPGSRFVRTLVQDCHVVRQHIGVQS